MKFALNYSSPAVELLEAGEIEIDYIKFPDWPDLVEQAGHYRPAVVHFTLAAGNNTLADADWGLVERLLAQTETRYVNLHFYPSVQAHGSEQPAVEAALTDIQGVARRFGAENVILENLPWPMPKGDLPLAAAEPAVLTRVVRESGCGLLLDLAHAWITARNTQQDEQQFLSALPVECIRELHLTGVDWHAGQLCDHLAMTAPDWAGLDWVAAQVREGNWPEPGYLTFEYGGVGEVFAWRTDREVIRSQAPRIVKAIR